MTLKLHVVTIYYNQISGQVDTSSGSKDGIIYTLFIYFPVTIFLRKFSDKFKLVIKLPNRGDILKFKLAYSHIAEKVNFS